MKILVVWLWKINSFRCETVAKASDFTDFLYFRRANFKVKPQTNNTIIRKIIEI